MSQEEKTGEASLGTTSYHIGCLTFDAVDFSILKALEHSLERLELPPRDVCVGVARPLVGDEERVSCHRERVVANQITAAEHRLVVGEDAIELHEGRDRHHEHCVGGGSAGSVGGVREGRRKGARG